MKSSRSPPRTTGTRRPCGRGLSVEEPSPRGDSPAPRRGSESELSFTANPNTRGFGRGYSTNQACDLKMTDSCFLHKMRVSCSACADWPRALQKHKQAQRRTTLALTSTQVTRGRDAERLLTRERLLHTHSACLSTAARAYSSERYAPLQSAKRKQLISGSNFFLYPPTSLSLRLARPTAGLGVGTLFHC